MLNKIIKTFLVIILMLLLGGIILITITNKKTEEDTKSIEEYSEDIGIYAEKYDIDPFLILGVIDAESGFDKNAVSSVGAMGLMQIMPETGKWIASEIGIEDFKEEDLFDPETNIMMGSWYLRFLLDKYNNNLGNSLAAYNGGHGNVDNWLLDQKYSEDGENLSNIPFIETKEYVKIVRKNIEYCREKYKNLFENY